MKLFVNCWTANLNKMNRYSHIQRKFGMFANETTLQKRSNDTEIKTTEPSAVLSTGKLKY